MRSLFQYAGSVALAYFLSLSLSSCAQPQRSSPGYGFDSQYSYYPAPQRLNGRRSNYPASSFVHIYQKDGGFGRAKIYLDGVPIAELREKRYFTIRVRPGLHRFHVSKPDQGELTFNVGRGRHYYVKNSEDFGGGKEELRLIDVERANYEIARMKMLEGKDVLRYELFVEPAMSSYAWR
ncbi:MAG: hypothetical protein AB7U82_09185 [Blastocatellales bacterium]